jgi:tetratricopeptide (TPR) repeat protein
MGDEMLLADALSRLGMAHALAGNTEVAATCLREAQPMLERSGRPRMQVRILMSLALVDSSRGMGRESALGFAAAAQMARAGGFDGQAFQALGNLADALWMQGDLDGARAAARDALAQSSKSAFATRNNVGLALANLHGILVERGDLAEAAVVGRDFIERSRDVGATWIVLDHFALRYAKSGRHDIAAKLTGWNEETVRRKAVRRQLNEQRAHESTMAILRAHLAADELERLLALGATLSEDDICRLAVTG